MDEPGEAERGPEASHRPGRIEPPSETRFDRDDEPEANGREQEERSVGAVGGQSLVEEIGRSKSQVEPGEERGALAKGRAGASVDRDHDQREQEGHGRTKGPDARAQEGEDESDVVRLEGAGILGPVVEDGMDALFANVVRHDADHGLVGGEGDAAPGLERGSREQGEGRQEEGGQARLGNRPTPFHRTTADRGPGPEP